MSAPVVPQFATGNVTGRLTGKVAFVTGTAGGQGRAVALLFGRAGATVLGADIAAAEERNAETAALAAAEGLAFHPASLDVSEEEPVRQWIDEGVADHGAIDILYNNAGFAHFASPADMTQFQWSQTLKYELDVIFNPTRFAWPHMVRQRSGAIINVASVAGMLATPGLPAIAHAAGKGGVIAVTRQYALEGADVGIRVNSISPGTILTPANRDFLAADPQVRAAWERLPAMRRPGEVEDVAYAALFFASDETPWITGINLPIDGGMSCKAGERAD